MASAVAEFLVKRPFTTASPNRIRAGEGTVHITQYYCMAETSESSGMQI